MNYEVVISNQAEEDIALIYSHILYDFKSRINAEAFLNRIYSEIRDLSFMAGSHHLYPNEPWYSEGLHYFSVNNYSIFYTVQKVENDKIDGIASVAQVAYGKRDLDAILRKDTNKS